MVFAACPAGGPVSGKTRPASETFCRDHYLNTYCVNRITQSDKLGQHLDGDGAVEARVGGFVDLAHAARAKGGLDLVRAERGACLQGHS